MPEYAFIDGRDPQAKPPLTVARLNLWAGLPRSMNRVTGQIEHGKRVRVVARKRCQFEDREMAKISRWFLTGWVPATWLSKAKEEPVGELYEPAPRAKRRRKRGSTT